MKLRALSLFFNWDKIQKEILADTNDVMYRHDIPMGSKVPKDLADIEGPLQLTKNGYPVAGQVLVDDFGIGSSSPALPIYIALYSLVAVLNNLLPELGLSFLCPIYTLLYFAGLLGFFGALSTIGFAILTLGGSSMIAYFAGPISMAGIPASYLHTVLGVLPGFLPLLYLMRKKYQRASEQAYQGATYGEAAKNSPKSQKNNSRYMQTITAMQDKSLFVKYGTAKGLLTFNGDSFAPDDGLPVGQSVADLSTHMAIFGSTGTGKSTLIRSLLIQIVNEPEETTKQGEQK